MSMVCPQCKDTFESSMQCPKCNVRTVYQAGKPPEALAGFAQSDGHRWGERSTRSTDNAGNPPRGKWHQAPLGRVAAGLLLALGLSYGLLQLSASTLHLWEKKSGNNHLSPGQGLALFVGLQALAVLAGGMLAGTGRRPGLLYGLVVGIVSGGVALASISHGLLTGLVQPLGNDLLSAGTLDRIVSFQGVPGRQLAFYGLPAVHMLSGALGGLIGSFIWKPLPGMVMPTIVALEAPAPSSESGLKAAAARKPKPPSLFGGSISWIRVLLGILAALAGALYNKAIMNTIVGFTEGYLEITDNFQEKMTIGVILALSVMLGGTIAGATTYNGIKQGFCVGIGAAIGQAYILISYQQARENLMFTIVSAVFLSMLGGWFGSTLLPPPPPPKISKRFGNF